MRTAPVQGGPPIPWALHEEAFAVYASKYGHDQSAERMAERGGFGAGELDECVPGWRDRHAAIVEAIEDARREGAERGWRPHAALWLREQARTFGDGRTGIVAKVLLHMADELDAQPDDTPEESDQ